MPAIEVRHLCKSFQISVKEPGLKGALGAFFRKRKMRSVDAVRDISFSVERGELVGFLGPNGAGKTTTLKMLSGLLYPTSGETRVMGFVPWKRERPFQMQFSMVMGQRTQLWWDLPIRETFVLNQKIFEIPEDVFIQRVGELAELLELEKLLNVPAKKLSLGERMKSELACALLHAPKVLLLDEPTLGLDILMQKKLRQFIIDYNRRTQSTILLTSHNMDDVEELCKRVIIIDNGQMYYDGALDKIVEHYAPDKLVTLTSAAPLSAEMLQGFGRLVDLQSTTAKIEIPRKEISGRVSALLSRIPAIDLSIEELAIEEIIRRVFQNRAAEIPNPAPAAETDPLTEPAVSLHNDRASS